MRKLEVTVFVIVLKEKKGRGKHEGIFKNFHQMQC